MSWKSQLDEVTELCEEHLAHEGQADERIASLVTRSLLIEICSTMERELHRLVWNRCAHTSDLSVREYLRNSTARAGRRPRVRELRELLGKFGSHHKDRFHDLVEGNEQAKIGYSSLITNRNEAAHGPCTATLGEVKRYFSTGRTILDYVEEALWVTREPPAGDG